MNKKILNLIQYNYTKINYSVIAILLTVLLCFTFYATYLFFKLNMPIINSCNTWTLYSFLYIDSDILTSILLLLSLYFTFVCFEDEQIDYFIKIRVNSYFDCFSSKILSIFLFNFFINIFTTVFIFILGGFLLRYEMIWANAAKGVYSYFYSPLKVALINISAYSFFVTFLSEILGILFIKIKNKLIPAIVAVSYIALDRFCFSFVNRIPILKYISLNYFLNFGNRDFYKNDYNYITVKSGVIIPILLMILTYVIIKYTFKRKKLSAVN